MEDQQNTEVPKQAKLSKGALRAAMAKTSSPTLGGMKGIPKRRITFLVDKDACEPGMFDDDFELTLTSLDSTIELKAAQRSGGNPTTLAMWFAFYAMVAINGEAINDAEGEREFLWEALGPARQLVIGTFADVGTPGKDAQGKARSSVRVE